MKLIFDEGEKERIENAYKRLKEMRENDGVSGATLFDDTNPGKEYSINFKVTNPGLAETILIGLLNNKLSDIDLGINVTSINFDAVTSKMSREELSQQINATVHQILGLQ